MPSKKKAPAPRRSLVQYVLDKKRADCPVCALPAEVCTEIAGARSRKIQRGTILEWLTTECGIRITGADFDRHYSARHDRDG